MSKSSDRPVLLVTIKFKKRGVLPNEFTIRLASTDFSDTYTVKDLIEEGYKKLQASKLSSNFLLSIPQRICGYGKYIGYDSRAVLAVYTEKDKGRIHLKDVARHVLVNNETIVVEYYDMKLTITTGVLAIAALAYMSFHARKYIHYRINRNN